jgi:glycerophosphoryl diester phosphodiesterase
MIRLQMSLFCGLALLFLQCQPVNNTNTTMSATPIATDWQGHRGARGLLPENTIPAMLKALEYPVTTLECDLAVTSDSQLVLSHEPWMSAEICSHPDGKPVTDAEAEQLLIYQMPLSKVKTFDCGKRGHPRFPRQMAMPAIKPALAQMVEAVDAYCKAQHRSLPNFNIEIKSEPEWYGQRCPEPKVFARLLLQELNRLGITARTCIQSFDPAVLNEVHAQAPEVITAFLVENPEGVEANLQRLTYTPPIYSPDYKLLQADIVTVLHKKSMKVIPWTVNDPETMQTLLKWGVDGIITDYPDLIPKAK